jgi:quercetin dioxygenase-like cupin family protein
MRIIRISQVEEESMPTVTPVPGWTGGPVARTRQPLVPSDLSENFNCSVVNFGRGATTGFHAHTSDQILVITAGVGIVATQEEEREVAVGDVVHISAGEQHWHGASKDSYMSHITITTSDSEAVR